MREGLLHQARSGQPPADSCDVKRSCDALGRLDAVHALPPPGDFRAKSATDSNDDVPGGSDAKDVDSLRPAMTEYLSMPSNGLLDLVAELGELARGDADSR